MRTSYLTADMASEQRTELVERTAAEHIAAAQELLAGQFPEFYGATSAAYYNWSPPTPDEVARAHAHAALASALLASASALLASEARRSARSARGLFSGGRGY